MMINVLYGSDGIWLVNAQDARRVDARLYSASAQLLVVMVGGLAVRDADDLAADLRADGAMGLTLVDQALIQGRVAWCEALAGVTTIVLEVPR